MFDNELKYMMSAEDGEAEAQESKGEPEVDGVEDEEEDDEEEEPEEVKYKITATFTGPKMDDAAFDKAVQAIEDALKEFNFVYDLDCDVDEA